MSLSLRDSVRVALMSDAVSGVRLKSGFGSRVAERHVETCEPARGEPPWSAAVGVLPEVISRLGQRAANAAVVLSNRFVRYTVVPWESALATPEEELAFARHAFAEIHGDAARAWDVRVSPGRVGQPRVACAVDAELLQALRTLFAASRLRLRSVQPHLMTAYNLCRTRLQRSAVLFLTCEKRAYTSMVLAGGKCRSIRSGALQARIADELPVLVDREVVWSGLAQPPAVYLYAPEEPEMRELPADSGIVTLRPRSAASQAVDAQYAKYAIAMSAA